VGNNFVRLQLALASAYTYVLPRVMVSDVKSDMGDLGCLQLTQRGQSTE
jgi:hypothetical protein